MLERKPCVFLVGNEYQITLLTKEFGIAWIGVNGKEFRSSRNGLMISETLVHRITVPMSELDSAKGYTVCFRSLSERKPYFPELGPVQSQHFAFYPIEPEKPIQATMLADTHSRIAEPLRAAAKLPRPNLLILNGDIPAESKTEDDIRAIFALTDAITQGEIPVVFARGNHDLRGRLATNLPSYIGTQNGDTWFTFRIGGLWGIVLDCGEDKEDDSNEYGGLVDCHEMRLLETGFLEKVIASSEEEFAAPGVHTRIALCHLPFTSTAIANGEAKFNIEIPLFTRWTELLNRMQIDVMLSGHMHRAYIAYPDTEAMRMGANFPVVVGSAVYPPKNPCSEEPHIGATYFCCGVQFPGDGSFATTLSDDTI